MTSNNLTNQELWAIFTSAEEYNPILVDKFNRNLYLFSKNRDVLVPTVSEYLFKNGFKPYYPDNKKFTMCLTHDIDLLYDNYSIKQFIKQSGKSIIDLDISLFAKTLKNGIKRRINDDYDIAPFLKYENKYNIKSSFFFLSLTKNEEDFNYELSEIKSVIEKVLQNKCEIGLHGGHLASKDSAKIKQEKEKLEIFIGQTITGYRNHYLRFKTPTTWECLERLNFKYDTTFGYADCTGFRNGMCYPFQPYNLTTKSFLNMVELPLIIMDVSLWKYMNLSEKYQLEICKNLIDIVAKNAGVLTLVWHNNHIVGNEGLLYKAILDYAYEKNAWFATANEITDYWLENNFHKELNDRLKQLRNIDNIN